MQGTILARGCMAAAAVRGDERKPVQGTKHSMREDWIAGISLSVGQTRYSCNWSHLISRGLAVQRGDAAHLGQCKRWMTPSGKVHRP